MKLIFKIGKAYAGATASCMLAQNVTEPLRALDWSSFTEASKTGGIFAVLVAVGLAFQQFQTQDKG